KNLEPGETWNQKALEVRCYNVNKKAMMLVREGFIPFIAMNMAGGVAESIVMRLWIDPFLQEYEQNRSRKTYCNAFWYYLTKVLKWTGVIRHASTFMLWRLFYGELDAMPVFAY